MDSNFHFHTKCISLGISHFAFVDDLLLFANGDVISVKILMDCLHRFGACSGLSTNALKPRIYPIGINDSDLQDILAITNFSRGVFPFRYLGIPLAVKKLKVIHYGPLTDKILNCIKTWTASSLSYAGKFKLIRVVLQGVECFWLSILPIPAAAIEKVYRLCRLFLWNFKSAFVPWHKVCLPKNEGGISLKDLKS